MKNLHKRITRYLENYSNIKYIPVHPDDYEILLKNNKLHSYPQPFVILGEIMLDRQE